MRTLTLSGAAAVLLALGVLGLGRDPAPAWADEEPAAPTLKLPETVEGKAATILDVKADTTGKIVRWVLLTPGLSTRATPDGRTLYVAGPAGRYELLAYTAAGDTPSEPARCVVVVGEPGPPPVPPGPTPPPGPVDALAVEIRALLRSDPAALPADVKALAKLYELMALESAKPEYRTPADLNGRYRSAVEIMLGAAKLVTVRRRAAVEIERAAGADLDADLTPETRTALAAVFARLARCVEEASR